MTQPTNDYLDTAMTRVVEMEKLAVTETKESFPYPWAIYDNFPYWVNYVNLIQPEEKGTAQERQLYVVKMRIVIGHMTQGYDGTLQRELWKWIPQTLNYFKMRKQLQYLPGQGGVTYLDDLGCQITLSRGFAIFQDSPGPHIGSEFDLRVPFKFQIDQAF